MAENKNDNIIILSNGRIPIICSKCLNKADNCNYCNSKGYTWQDVYTGEVKYKEKFVHTIYKKQK